MPDGLASLLWVDATETRFGDAEAPQGRRLTMARRKLHLVLMSEDRHHIIGCAWACPACHPKRAFEWTLGPQYYASALGTRAFGYYEWPKRRKGAKP